MFLTVLTVVQFIFSIIIGLYFLTMLKDKGASKEALKKHSEREMLKLSKMRQIRLTEPLSERTRPKTFDDIIGQKEAIRALRASLCGPNPQHVIIYGPPGVGKTAAARIILEEAKKSKISPFSEQAKFIETDATIMRFDERNIADPLIGSVHDPIYQGAGAYGVAGVPQPKPGAVTKAHGGILFIDEIGELHSMQINKMLKVLEDRKVFLESAYYTSDDTNIPLHIHEIFQKGLPADFRLVGATTRNPEEISPAIRSRCVEIFFDALTHDELVKIAKNAAQMGNFNIEDGVDGLIATYSTNGRDAVNMVQTAASLCLVEDRGVIRIKDIEWVAEVGKYSPRMQNKILSAWRVGCVSALAVAGGGMGITMDIEIDISEGTGIELCGITESECIDAGNRKLTRTSTAKSSVKNAIILLKKYCKIDLTNKHLHINIPGGMPVDGPSAGIAIFCAIYSAATNTPIDSKIAFSGELSITGKIKPVGGIVAKVDAAKVAGAKKVIIPKDNAQKIFEDCGIEVIPMDNLNSLLDYLFNTDNKISTTTTSMISALPL